MDLESVKDLFNEHSKCKQLLTTYENQIFLEFGIDTFSNKILPYLEGGFEYRFVKAENLRYELKSLIFAINRGRDMKIVYSSGDLDIIAFDNILLFIDCTNKTEAL